MSQQHNTLHAQDKVFLFLPILIPHLQFLNKIIAGFNIFMLQGSDGCKNWLVFFLSIWRMQNIWSVVDVLVEIHNYDLQ
jgi:hypothetical protein